VIRGGQIVDGTGSEPVPGDLAIDDGLITEVGVVRGVGSQEIDAEGHMVTPGFVDLHTHLDAQIGWDPLLTPISWHGVTTALLGNCGMTFAPCRPEDRELLAGMMETVEDIPREAILGGLPWTWEDYGGYLDTLEGIAPAINVAGLIGHCALRYYVMGPRSVEEQASDAEKTEMAEIVARAIDAGAFGFSTNRLPAHVAPDGRPVPGTFADAEELIEIARAVGPRDGLMQNVLDFTDPVFCKDLLRNLAQTTGGRILFSYGVGADPGSGKGSAAFLDQICEGGLDITAISQPRGSGFMLGLQGLLPVRSPAWRRLRRMDFESRLAAIDDADLCRELVAEAKAEQGQTLPADQVFSLGTDRLPNYTAPREESLGATAKAAGEHWSETFLRIARESRGKALFTFRQFNASIEALEELFKNERAFPSLGDAGAHVSQIMDAGWASFVLSYWVRDRGLYSMGEGVRRLSSAPARVVGLKDRGVLTPGMCADVNVFDAETVGELQPEIVNDFPGGAPRFIQRSQGYRATVVNGQVAVLDGEHTDARAGAVLRHSY
jgi:N-acyl-D-aspartate/D-glutamate deacylase